MSDERNKLIAQIDSAYEQIIWAYQASEALKSIYFVHRENLAQFNQSKNFFCITRLALASFYSMELVKLIDRRKGVNIFKILEASRSNKSIFCTDFSDGAKTIKNFDVVEYTKSIENELEKHRAFIDNLKARRDKTLAHNDKEFFHFSKTAIDTYPLADKEFDEITAIIYNCLRTLHLSCNSEADLHIATDIDDLKRLFGLETEADLTIKKWTQKPEVSP